MKKNTLDPSSQTPIELTASGQTFRIVPDKIDTITRIICAGLRVDDLELSWDFVDDEEMQALNRQYREKDRTTDVLSFPQFEWDEPLSFTPPLWPLPEAGERDEELPPEALGDVIMSPSVALANARSIGHDLDREVCFLLVHGILHLCGHDHMVPAEEERMTKEQQAIMKFLETVDGAPLWTGCATLVRAGAR